MLVCELTGFPPELWGQKRAPDKLLMHSVGKKLRFFMVLTQTLLVPTVGSWVPASSCSITALYLCALVCTIMGLLLSWITGWGKKKTIFKYTAIPGDYSGCSTLSRSPSGKVQACLAAEIPLQIPIPICSPLVPVLVEMCTAGGTSGFPHNASVSVVF